MHPLVRDLFLVHVNVMGWTYIHRNPGVTSNPIQIHVKQSPPRESSSYHMHMYKYYHKESIFNILGWGPFFTEASIAFT